MIELTLLSDPEAGGTLRQALGGDPADVAGVADLIRGEVSARGACPRAATIRRVRRFVAPATDLDETLVENVCGRLERGGDIVLGAGGVLYATPLRAVDLGDRTLRIASSLPTRRLRDGIAGSWTVSGVSRTCRVEDLDQARLAVAAAEGVVITPADWACLDRVPRADRDWLDGLDRRLGAEPEAPDSLERDEDLAWSGCAVTPNGIRWKSKEPEPSTRLWRARNRWGHWHYGWTRQGAPGEAPFVSLRPDEGTRSVFALARDLGMPLTATVVAEGETVTLSVSHWLPVAEYRFLAVSAAESVLERDGGHWTMPRGRLAGVIEVLRERLGIAFREEIVG